MAPGRPKHEEKRKVQRDLRSSLLDIANMLPLPEPLKARTLTKKETLVHMLCYLDFLCGHIQSLQARLLPDCIPATGRTHLINNYKQARLLHLSEWAEPEQEIDPGLAQSHTGDDNCQDLSDLHSYSEGPTDSTAGSPLLRDRMLSSVDEDELDTPLTPVSPVTWGSLSLQPRPPHTLKLSPSLLTSPAHGLTEAQEELQGLFEDVWISPKTGPATALADEPDSEHSDSSEDEDGTWTPALPRAAKKYQHSSRRSATWRRRRSNAGTKKKCVNGFIMFCRINRKVYLRLHPGTPSTVVTKELASLWHDMPKQERRVYCTKARRFSRQQNRHMRAELEEEEEDESEEGHPSPLHLLMARRDTYNPRHIV